MTPSFNFDDSKQTVEGRLTGLLNQDSPYLQQARDQGAVYASSRGLLNSSAGAKASQQAAIQAALPIAQQDAGAYNSFAQMSYGDTLQQGTMRLGNDLQKELNQQNQGFTQDNMRLDQSWRSGEAAQEREFQSGQADLDRQQQLTVQSNEIRSRLEELGMRFDNDVKLTDIQQQYNILNHGMNGISAILADPNMSNATKQQAIANQNSAINSQLQFVSRITGQNFPTYG